LTDIAAVIARATRAVETKRPSPWQDVDALLGAIESTHAEVLELRHCARPRTATAGAPAIASAPSRQTPGTPRGDAAKRCQCLDTNRAKSCAPDGTALPSAAQPHQASLSGAQRRGERVDIDKAPETP